MAIIKCKMCGGDMLLSPDKTYGMCDYCGSTMTLPRVSDNQRAAAFNRGNHFRRTGDFDKALAVYERIVSEDDTDAEAHWCCALCRFGIEYVEDPNTFEYIPTCHRASFDSILEDVDYQAAIRHSDGMTRRQYQKDAARIAEVQRGILATSQKEEPFDVFLCYKETDDQTRQRTRDSLDAQEIYYSLTSEGFRVFFSRITLEDKAGAEYEPYIFAALHSARVMVVIGEKAEYFSAVWVKNEWSRFLALMKKDRSKLLLPCYKNVDPYDLPEQLSVLQSYDMTKIGFMQDLIRGIKKVLQKDEPRPSAPAARPAALAAGPNAAALLRRGQIALEDRDWTAAEGFFDQVLNMDAECAEAYYGKALAEAKCSSGRELVQAKTTFAEPPAETVEACEKDPQNTMEQAVNQYAVPGYFQISDILAVFSYTDRTYSSTKKTWWERVNENKSYWETDRNMSRALRFARVELADTLTGLRQEITDSLRAELEASIQADRQQAEQVAKRYTEEQQMASQKAERLCREAMQQRLEDYQTCCRRQEQAATPQEWKDAAVGFESPGLRGFRDCDARAARCREQADRLQREASQGSLRHQRDTAAAELQACKSRLELAKKAKRRLKTCGWLWLGAVFLWVIIIMLFQEKWISVPVYYIGLIVGTNGAVLLPPICLISYLYYRKKVNLGKKQSFDFVIQQETPRLQALTEKYQNLESRLKKV